ncbi:hypothetical protein HDU93_005212 [Gonapodya sp. JEL0774]|nr:hypothetical protein HDU93_005212 [Gonapodya sp. JEL0774]
MTAETATLTAVEDVEKGSPTKVGTGSPANPETSKYEYTTKETIFIGALAIEHDPARSFILSHLYPGTTKPRHSVCLISLSILLAALDSTIVATASPVIVSELDGTSLYSWVGNSYLLTSTALQPLWGKLSDIFGRKRSLLFVVVVFLGGSAFCGAASSMIMLIVARAIQGVGGGGIFAVTYVVISEIVPLRERGKYTGIIASTWALASLIGPLLGGVFTDTISWRWAFWIIVGILVYLRLPPPKGSIRDQLARVDWIGSFIFTSAITLLLLGLSFGVFLVTLFVFWELHYAKEPVIPMSLFEARNVRFAFVATFAIGVNMFGVSYFVPLYLQSVKGFSATSSGLVSLPESLVISFVIMAAGFATARTGQYIPFIWFGTAVNCLCTALYLIFDVDTAIWVVIVVMMAQGFGMAFVMQNIIMTSQTAVSDRLIGPVSSVAIFLRTIGGTVGLAVLGSVFSNAFGTKLEPELAPIYARIEGAGGSSAQLRALFGSNTDTFSLEKIIKSLAYDESVREALRSALISSQMYATHLAFAAAIPFAGLCLVVVLFLRHIPLRTTSSLKINLDEEQKESLQKDALEGVSEVTVGSDEVVPLKSDKDDEKVTEESPGGESAETKKEMIST